MNDVKLFTKNEKKLETTLKTGHRDEFFHRKSSYSNNKKLKMT